MYSFHSTILPPRARIRKWYSWRYSSPRKVVPRLVASIATHLLGHWVRREQKVGLEEAVHWLTGRPATAFGFAKRGNVKEGYAADLVVFDPREIGPEIPRIEYDLPGGSRRLVQKARGIAATVVAGDVLLRNGVHTGALPGKLLRRVAAAR